MRLLVSLTYYRPHVSGLTIYVQRLAEGLASRGHEVTVLTSQYDPSLPREEVFRGVRVVRVPVLARLSKGTLMPRYLPAAARELREHDAVLLNLPTTPVEAVLVPLLARVARRPAVATYHCDVLLPPGPINRLVTAGVFASDLASGALVHGLVAYTAEYAAASRVLRRFPEKVTVIPPPVAIDEPDARAVADWRRREAPGQELLIGFVARLAAEKGAEVMLRALPAVRERFGPVRVLFAGEHEHVIGEAAYRNRMRPLLERAGEAWRFLGVLSPEQLPAFYAACDLTVLPSLNRTESFGLVQVESMLCGTPVVASALPGVSVPVRTTGMGLLVPPGDAEALTSAIIEVATRRQAFRRPRGDVEAHFSVARTVAAYEELLARLSGGMR